MSDYTYIIVAAAVVFAIILMSIPSPPRDIVVIVNPVVSEPQR